MGIRNRKRCRFALIAAAVGVIPSNGRAQTTWQAGVGSWFVGGNWTNGVPIATNGQVTSIANGGTAQITSGTAVSWQINLGYSSASQSGSVAMSGGELAGSSIFNPTIYVGGAGTGSFTQSGGVVDSAYDYLGAAAGGVGTYALSAGTLEASLVDVGTQGSASFTQTGGTAALESDPAYIANLVVGQNTGVGTYSLQLGTLSAPQFEILGESGTGANAIRLVIFC